MRIIAGVHKGRRITAPQKLPVRPTKDMAKEALFNILNNQYYFADISVIDLFAGTGNISYEFASTGHSKDYRRRCRFRLCTFYRKSFRGIGNGDSHF